MLFQTDFVYTDRTSKAKYVWLKYHSILTGSILDVGADECHLKSHLPPEVSYWGIGLGDKTDQQVNLETEKIPFADRSFDCVICLDVLEHLDNIHSVFDEICRVTKHYAIISLPNPWGSFLNTLTHGDYKPGKPMKFYGLPSEPPEDRHKWFFSHDEAKTFMLDRSQKNNMIIVQMDYEIWGNPNQIQQFRPDIDRLNFSAGPLWTVISHKF